jgi:hypothetical protein
MKKIIKIVLLVMGTVWLGLELFNLGSYICLKNTHNLDYQYQYSPVFFSSIRSIVSELNPVVIPMGPPCSGSRCPVYKPVIYLYPTQAEKVKVELDYKGKIIADYPSYDYSKKGWEVTAYPDGKIINQDGKEYSYLFWEGESTNPISYDLSTGFIVKGEDTIKFLQETLSKIGLTPKEYNEFIVYWYPKMKDNKYNLIHFVDKQYTDTAPLTITPKPDSMLRVFMVFKPVDGLVKVKSQEMKSFNRTGFSVVEWGGTELK